MIYDVDYFIRKFEAIPETKIITERLSDGSGNHCSNGWCMQRGATFSDGSHHMINSPESNALCFIFEGSHGYSLKVARINNGEDDRYQQPTPKQRILAALRDIKSAQEKPQQPEVKEKTVYVTVDSSVRELQQKELSVN